MSHLNPEDSPTGYQVIGNSQDRGRIDTVGVGAFGKIQELADAGVLWTREGGELIKSRFYPRANFSTNPTPGGYDLELVVKDRLDLQELKISMRNSPNSRQSEDYYLRPHVFVPAEKLWLSDGHRYLPAITELARASGIPVNRVLSIDLDYFSKMPPERWQTEATTLIQAAIAASLKHDVVIADLHEDNRDRTERRNLSTYEEIVSATDSGVIRDENFIGFMAAEHPIIIKPPIRELLYTLRTEPEITITNPDFLLAEEPKSPPSLLERFDVIQLCTSPGYFRAVHAFKALQVVRAAINST